ncbi:DNA-binding protein Alba [Candidatus Bathyarchaeota archaeon]|nr:MAG: DNA-binding protein Alba [Candidatus Bathyarchaeota archaeon]
MTEEKPKEESAEKAVKEEKATEAPQTRENTVFIGRKPVMNYVIACLTFFNSGSKEIVVKARGRAISGAVDAVELLRRGFVKDLQLEISIGTEQMTGSEGQTRSISTIALTLTKP